MLRPLAQPLRLTLSGLRIWRTPLARAFSGIGVDSVGASAASTTLSTPIVVPEISLPQAPNLKLDKATRHMLARLQRVDEGELFNYLLCANREKYH
jgi:hypothetical protein